MKERNSFNDGMMFLYRKKTERNIRGLEDLEYLSKLAFDYGSIRQQDAAFASQNDKKISLKVETQNHGGMDTKQIAVIEKTIYAIIHIDKSKDRKKLYFYLEEVRKIE